MRKWINLFENTDPTATPAFRAWFGQSKVVEDNGEPLVVYHGGSSWRTAPGITWFTNDPHVADGYADQGYGDAEIKPCYLRIENPLDLRDPAAIATAFPNGMDEYVHAAYAHREPTFALMTSRDAIQHAIAFAQQHGYDGVIHPDTNVSNRGQHTSYVIFSPRQVKAARFQGWEGDLIYGDHARFDDGNKGGFDPEQDDITEGDS